MDQRIEAQVDAALGSPIATATRAAWGFKNETWNALLRDGRHVMVQIFGSPADAFRRVSAMRQFAEGSDLPVPLVLADGPAESRPWAVSTRLEGVTGYERAGSDLAGVEWPAMAAAMGQATRSLRSIPVERMDLPDLWSRPFALREAALGWAARIRPHCSAAADTAVGRLIDAVPETLGSFTPVVCHGDFGPQNALFTGTELTGLIDLEDARLGHPLLDIAWWNWLVRAHTPRAFERSWPGFLQAAGIDHSADGFDRRVRTLIVLRLLETAETYRLAQPEKHPSWGIRIETELGLSPTG